MKKGIDYPGVSIVFMCHDGAGNFLLHRRSEQCRDEHGRWDCGGGGLDLGDAVINTLQKELEEEFGTNVLDHHFLGYRDVHREHEGVKTHWIALDFLVHVDREKVVNNEPHKFEELGWFKWGEFPEPRHSQFPPFFEKHEEKIKELLEI